MNEKLGSDRDWSSLYIELLWEIAVRLQLIEDFTAFRGVCSSWRSAVIKNDFGAKSGSVPLLLLAKKHGPKKRQLYSISKKKVFTEVPLPHAALRKCLEARFGWLVVILNSHKVSLLNPKSQAKIQLPDLTDKITSAFRPSYVWFDFISQTMLSSNPSDDSSKFELMMVAEGFLLVWRPGDDEWRVLETKIRRLRLGHCKGKIFGFDSVVLRNVLVIDPNTLAVDYIGRIPVGLITHNMESYHSVKSCHLVESSDGELLLVVMHSKDWNIDLDKKQFSVSFNLIRIDVDALQCEVLSSLDEDTVFIGPGNTPICVRASSSGGIKPNHIYFCGNNKHFKPMGVYNLQDQSFERFSGVGHLVDPDNYYTCPPLWIDSSIILRDE